MQQLSEEAPQEQGEKSAGPREGWLLELNRAGVLAQKALEGYARYIQLGITAGHIGAEEEEEERPCKRSRYTTDGQPFINVCAERERERLQKCLDQAPLVAQLSEQRIVRLLVFSLCDGWH